MEFIPAKQILSSWSDGSTWFGSNYNMNVYKGCSHGCIYCDSRSECYRVQDFDRVRSKTDVLEILESELRKKRRKGLVSSGAMSDPYNPQERTHRLTESTLKLLDRYGFGASVLTKSDLVTRDLAIFQSIQKHSPTAVKFTITTADDLLAKRIEPHVAVSSDRFRSLSKAADAGIFTGVNLWPILPFITDTTDNIRQIVRMAADNGAQYVCPSPNYGVTLRQNQRAYYYRQLDRLFPGLKRRYQQIFGLSYECRSPQGHELQQALQEECQTHGLLYRMQDIAAAITERYRPKQLSLF